MKMLEEIKEKCCSRCEAECDGCWLKELITEYTKQVRKEVCEKIYKVLEQVVPHNLCWTWSIINKELNIMRGERK